MSKQNKVAVNLAQDFTDEEKAQARSNIGAANVHVITIDYASPTMNDDDFAELESAVDNNEEVLICVGMTSSTVYYKLAVQNSSEYRFESHIANGLSTLTINRITKTKAFSTKSIGVPTITTYSASFGTSWHSMRKISSSINNGDDMLEIALESSITLSAGKKYLITPVGLEGNVEQTKTASEKSNVSYSLNIWLCDSSKTFSISTAVILGEAEIANHYRSTLGQYPLVDGVYRGSFSPTSAIIEPTQKLTLDTLRIINSGNISFGFSTSSPAILVFDARITGINVMEIL